MSSEEEQAFLKWEEEEEMVKREEKREMKVSMSPDEYDWFWM
jgi:hypothetical protein